MAETRLSGTGSAGREQDSDPAVLALSVLTVVISTALVGVRLLAGRRAKKAIAASSRQLAIDTATTLHEKAWKLAGGDQDVAGVHHQLDRAYADVSALVLDLGGSGRAPYEGPTFEERLRLAVEEAGTALDRFEAFTPPDPERVMAEVGSARDVLETAVRPRAEEAGMPWMSNELASQWDHLNWEPYRFVEPGAGAAALAVAVDRYLEDGRSTEDLLAALTSMKGELEDRRDCVYVIGLLIDFTFDLAESFGARPPTGSART